MAAEAAGDDGRTSGDQPAWYGDSAYGTGDLRDAIAAAGHQAVIKPKPLLPAVPGGFTADDFTVDAAAGTVTCPAGITRHVTARTPSSSAPPAGAARCASGAPPPKTAAPCTCTSTTACCAPPARTGPPARAARGLQAHRPNVERAIAQVATWRGRRLKLRYRGAARNHAWLKRRTAALNLRNLIGRGLTRHDGAWVLAT